MIHDAREWQAAMQALLLVAEQDGPTMFARIGVMRALHRLQPKVAPTRRKRAKAYRIVRSDIQTWVQFSLRHPI